MAPGTFLGYTRPGPSSRLGRASLRIRAGGVGPPPSAGLWFWRDRTGNEVDLVLEIDRKLVAVECKLADRPSARDGAGIAKLREFYGPDRVPRSYVACTTRAEFEVAPGVVARPGRRTWAAV